MFKVRGNLVEEKNEDAIKNFEKRHKLGKEHDERRGSGKLIVFLVILIGVGAWAYTSGWNPFVKKWYEDCNSELMKKSYVDGFKLAIQQINSKYKVKDIELISIPKTIETEPLKCSVRVSYKIDLSIYKYQVGTVTLVRETVGYDKENNSVNADLLLVDDVSNVHSLFNGNY